MYYCKYLISFDILVFSLDLSLLGCCDTLIPSENFNKCIKSHITNTVIYCVRVQTTFNEQCSKRVMHGNINMNNWSHIWFYMHILLITKFERKNTKTGLLVIGAFSSSWAHQGIIGTWFNPLSCASLLSFQQSSAGMVYLLVMYNQADTLVCCIFMSTGQSLWLLYM